ncbi:MAG: hypothetical protein M3432_04865 [Chloroflexota bacterium]|nr:hypothetical protein [Chloroflexota bacterium]
MERDVQLALKEKEIGRLEARYKALYELLRVTVDASRSIADDVVAILEDADHPAQAATAAKVERANSLAHRARALRAQGRSIPEIARALDRSERQVSRYFPRDTSSKSH